MGSRAHYARESAGSRGFQPPSTPFFFLFIATFRPHLGFPVAPLAIREARTRQRSGCATRPANAASRTPSGVLSSAVQSGESQRGGPDEPEIGSWIGGAGRRSGSDSVLRRRTDGCARGGDGGGFVLAGRLRGGHGPRRDAALSLLRGRPRRSERHHDADLGQQRAR